MNANPRRLPCGAEIEQLVAQVADTEPAADPAHQAHCPYCQATLRRLRDAWEDVHTLANQPVPIPPTLTAQIMARVRILARHATDSILLGHPRGETRISHALVGRVIQRVALGVPGVIFASWFASESMTQIRVLITQHLRGFRHLRGRGLDDRAGTFSRQCRRRLSTEAVSLAFAEV